MERPFDDAPVVVKNNKLRVIIFRSGNLLYVQIISKRMISIFNNIIEELRKY